jgi:hypothetical protein
VEQKSMKKLKIPEVKYGFTDADWIFDSLKGKLNASKKQKEKLTLYGAYKNIRTMTAYAALGDYVILSQCVRFFKGNKLPLTQKEVYRCFRYFEDYDKNQWKLYENRAKDLLSQGEGEV